MLLIRQLRRRCKWDRKQIVTRSGVSTIFRKSGKKNQSRLPKLEKNCCDEPSTESKNPDVKFVEKRFRLGHFFFPFIPTISPFLLAIPFLFPHFAVPFPSINQYTHHVIYQTERRSYSSKISYFIHCQTVYSLNYAVQAQQLFFVYYHLHYQTGKDVQSLVKLAAT